ncbi:MAG: endonuclease/exonuclease/phosphatase family protein, partial [Candidatus Promineifilaceae bacterium]
FTWIANRQQLLPTRLACPLVVGLNAVFAVALALVALAHQPDFPGAASAYPLAEPQVTVLAQLPLLLALLLYPVLLVDFVLLTEALIAARPTLGSLGLAFGVGSLFLSLMIFAQVFTTTYDYIPVIGPYFRDQFWLVLLLPGLILTLAVLLARRPVQRPADGSGVTKGSGAAFSVPLVLLVGLLGAISLAGAWLIGPRPPTPVPGRNVLRVLTYNIQQGYDEMGRRGEAEQLSLIRRLAPDIIGLQESDNARIAGGNSDLVRTFADRLDMYSYYGPKTVAGTFGIALLSRYPIQEPRTFYVYSEGEQVAVIEAQIEVGDQTFDVYVTHLGNGGPLIQQKQLLETLAGKERVIAMGDFNFKPGSEQYELTTTVLDDSWWRQWPDGVDDQGVRPDALPFGWSWLDHIFVSPDVDVVDARYVLEPASDHPPVTADITW